MSTQNDTRSPHRFKRKLLFASSILLVATVTIAWVTFVAWSLLWLTGLA
jgi:hypothetical protein